MTPMPQSFHSSSARINPPTVFSQPPPPPPPLRCSTAMGKLLTSLLQALHPSAWKLEPEPSTFARSSAWSNKDMDPVPPDLRTWTTFNYVVFWISDAANAPMWAFASSMLAIGLSWFVILLPYSTDCGLCPPHTRWQALLAIALGNIIMGIVMVLNGTTGARLHIPFPILNRSSFGFWLSYFSVISRVVLSLFWFGIQTFVGSECVYQVLPFRLSPIHRDLIIIFSDAKSNLAILRSSPESPSSKREHNYLRCV